MAQTCNFASKRSSRQRRKRSKSLDRFLYNTNDCVGETAYATNDAANTRCAVIYRCNSRCTRFGSRLQMRRSQRGDGKEPSLLGIRFCSSLRNSQQAYIYLERVLSKTGILLVKNHNRITETLVLLCFLAE